MRTLTQRELNRALLARQLLLEPARMPVTRAIERLGGVQAQWEPAVYTGLATRLAGFRPAELRHALAARRVVRATLMRATVHAVSTRDYLLFLPALLTALRSRSYNARGPEIPDLDALSARTLAFAATPRTAAELKEHVGGDEPDYRWSRVRHHVPFVRVDGDYVAAESWVTQPFGDPDEGIGHLLRRYLAAFGPATLADAATWSGLQVAELRPAAESLPLRRFRDEAGRTLVDLPRAPLPAAETPAPPRLLPRFDNAILSHADRTRIIADEHRRIVIRAAEVNAVFLVDGFAAGRWRIGRKGLELDPFGPLSRRDAAALEEEASRLAGSGSRRPAPSAGRT